ncbi:hypothetical protein [Streptomyces regalis]|uniref:Uncharacterized protein n=1 Tax=Streptomyces regalis TaxID=68262 RepID=A0A101JIM1_9ACTN|nr:hypothetical protein [Streptomyces regalis]KUL27096.1 hypothetical protein ADL12_30940 [Streptomyces regalis]
MRNIAKAAAVTASVLLAGVAVATPAQAATKAKHEGRSGCFNYSWGDGVSTTTVYYHNICNHKATINIWWKDGAVDYMKADTVKADGKGSMKHTGDLKSVSG